jgi:hypothetical protein
MMRETPPTMKLYKDINQGPALSGSASTLLNQYWLLNRLKAAGYLQLNAGDEAVGVCFGIANMAMQALLVGDEQKFNQRLWHINTITDSDMATSVAKDSDLAAFFEGVELYQQVWRHQDLFPPQNFQISDATPAISLLVSQKLEKLGGMQSITKFTGFYNYEELINFFTSLRVSLKEGTVLSHPVSLSIVTANHAINATYKPDTDEWMFINANQLPPYAVSTNSEVAWHVMTSLFGSKNIAFATEVYTTGDQSEEVKKRITSWKESEIFKNIHQVTAIKSNQIDDNGGSWLFLAARKGMLEEVNNLLAANANPNLEITYMRGGSKTFPLDTAIRNGHHEVVSALLEAGARDVPDSKNKLNQLYYAVTDNKTEIALALIKKAKDEEFDLHDSKKRTPIMFAVYHGNSRIVNALLARGLDVNAIDPNSDQSLLDIATENKNMEMKDLLKAHGGKTAKNIHGGPWFGFFSQPGTATHNTNPQIKPPKLQG